MGLKLDKLLGHLRQGDEDMAVLALRTFMRSPVLPGSEDPAQLQEMRRALLGLVESNEEDVRFFAREALEKVGELLSAAGVSVPEMEGDEETLVEGVDQIVEGETEPVTFRAPTVHGTADAMSGVKSPTAIRALRALHALGQAKDDAAVAKVLALYGSAEDPWIKASCLSTLGRMGRTAGLRTIVSALRHPHPRVRANAVEAIAGIAPRDRCIAVYLDGAGDPDRRVRTNALRGLAEVDPVKVLDLLEAMVASGKISARASAAFVLGRMGGRRVLDLLERLVADEAEEIRLRCVKALEKQKGLRALTLLRRLVCDMDIDVAEKALAVYERKKDEEGVQDSQGLDLEVVRSALRLDEAVAQAGAAPAEDGLEALLAAPDGGMRRDEEPVAAAPVSAELDVPSPPEALAPEAPVEAAPAPREDPPAGVALGGGPGRAARRRPARASRAVAAPAPDPAAENWPEAPEVTERLHDVYDRIDEVLVAIGRQVDEEEKANLFDGEGRFDKLLYTLRRYQQMIERRREASKESTFFENFVRRSEGTSDPAMLRLENTLFEQYRLIGEFAMDLATDEDLRFPQFNRAYKDVARLLEEAESVKAS